MTRTTALAALALLGTGCLSTLTGNEGNFQFSYDADDRVLDFNKPIAVGAFLDLEVRDVGARQPVSLTSAAFDDPSVLTVSSFADHRVTVQGVSSGQALLEVAGTTSAGTALTDSVNLLARVPEVMKLWHTCTDADTAGYLVNSRAWVPFDLEMANSQPVIGYGYYPVTTSDPVLGLNETDSFASHLALDVGATPGSPTLTSDIDGTTLTMRVFSADQIDGVVEPIGFVWEDIDAGDSNSFYVLPSVKGQPICQANTAKTVTSLTEDICTVSDGQLPQNNAPAQLYEYGWFQVTGVAEGTCRFEVTYPAGNDGLGASGEFEVEIEP